MDAFRNAKEIARAFARVEKLERKLVKEITNPNADKIDYALEAYKKEDKKNTKLIENKLLILIFLLILDKIIIISYLLYIWTI